MNVGQSKILLDKINSLFKSISADDGPPSAIERDLMLSYVRQLYDACLAETGIAAAPVAAPPAPKPAPRPEPVVKKYVPPVVETPAAPKARPEPVAPPPPVQQPEPVVKAVEQPAPPAPKPEPVIATPAPEPEKVVAPPPPPVRQATTSVRSSNKAIESLFETRAAKELSEKLGERRIEDLTRSMSINDRLLYINDLFGKDQPAMEDTLKLLNKYDSMDEAKTLLINLAEQYNWADDEKQETARHFIKLVRRRYV